jgi:transcriptional regulator with XRE-family HTH domain
MREGFLAQSRRFEAKNTLPRDRNKLSWMKYLQDGERALCLQKYLVGVCGNANEGTPKGDTFECQRWGPENDRLASFDGIHMVDYVTSSGAPQVHSHTLEESIGRQVRQLRTRLGLTGAEFAAAAQISTSMLSKIETGQISASLQTLQSIATALNVPIANLFAIHEPRQDCSFVPANSGVTIERRGTKAGHKYQLLGHSLDREIAVEPYLITLAQDAVPYTSFQHEGLEIIYMLTGQVTYRHGDTSHTLNPGDTLFFDSSAPHGPETLHSLPMTYLSIIIYRRD